MEIKLEVSFHLSDPDEYRFMLKSLIEECGTAYATKPDQVDSFAVSITYDASANPELPEATAPNVQVKPFQ